MKSQISEAMNNILLEHSHIHYVLPMAAFTLSWQNWIVAVETKCPAKCKIFTL